MKSLNPDDLLKTLCRWDGRTLTFMEVCGTHTMAIAKAGLRSLLPERIRLISGPGCPVCVTPVGYVDHALALAARPDVVIATFGDLIRVPGSLVDKREGAPNLARARADGADVRVVFSPLDAINVARREVDKQVVFLGVGFETTAPTIASAIVEAARLELENFSVLGANKTIPEAMELLCTSGDIGLDGFLCPGHVSIILGPEPYQPLVDKHGLACAVAGFEPVEVLQALVSLVSQVATEQPRVDNCYPGAVRPGGNARARDVMYRVFEPADTTWRGLGVIEHSGLAIREEYAAWDAARRFDVALPPPLEPRGCCCGDVLRGVLAPEGCPLFGTACTAEAPVGACMVSSEGTCAAAYHYAGPSLVEVSDG